MPTRQFCDLCDAHIPDEDWYSQTILSVIPSDGNRYPIKELLIGKEHVNPESTVTQSMICQKCTRHILALFLSIKSENLH